MTAASDTDAAMVTPPIPATLWPVLILLATTPAIFAILTYQPRYSFLWTRYFSLPVLAAELAIITCAVLAGYRPWRDFQQLEPVTRIVTLLFVTGILLSAILATANPLMAFAHAAITLLHGVLLLALLSRLGTTWYAYRGTVLLAAGVGAALLLVLIYPILLTHRDDPGFNWGRVGMAVSNLRHYSYVGAIAGGIGAGLLAAGSRRFAMIAGWVICTLGLTLVVWTGSRSGVFALAFAFLLAVAMAPPGRRLQTLLGLILAGVVATLLSLIWIPNPAWGLNRLLGRMALETADGIGFDTGRLTMWAKTATLVLERPWFGYGEGQFHWFPEVSMGRFLHPHNAVIQVFFQWGFAGLVTLAVLHVRALPTGFRALVQDRPVALPAATGLVALAAVAMVDGPLFYVYPSAIYCLLWATLAARHKDD